MAMKYVPLFCSNRQMLALLSDAERGRLLLALLDYAETGALAHFTGKTEVVFLMLQQEIDRAAEHYDKRCQKNRENIQKRWENVHTNEYDGIRTNTNHTKEKAKEKAKAKAKETETADTLLFARFWQAYPKKVEKKSARRAFDKLYADEALLQAMLDALDWQKQSDAWTRENGRYIPNPSTWLNNARWEDEKPMQGSGVSAPSSHLVTLENGETIRVYE